MKKEVRKCAVCGKKFVAKSINQKYCMTKCKRKAAKEAEKKIRKDRKAGAKIVAKKPVVKAVCKQKVVLPPKPSKVVKVVKVVAKKPAKVVEVPPIVKHVINRGDIITFNGFEPMDVLKYAVKLQALVMSVIGRQASEKAKGKKGK